MHTIKAADEWRRESPGAGRVTRRHLLGLSTMAAGLAATGVAGCGSAAPASAPARTSASETATTSAGETAGASSNGAAAGRVTAPPPAGVVAANMNQDLDVVDFAELQAVSATWIRGFYPMQQADQGDVAAQPGMRKLTSAIQNGYGTVLNLKFDYEQGLPDAGSSEMNVAFERLDKVLAVVMGKVDIVVIGNEPFFECGQKTGNLNAFYEAVAQHAIDYRKQHPGPAGKTEIYMGALTDLENPKKSDIPLINRWLDYVKGNPDIAGTDCHPHVASMSDCQRYLDYIIPRIRADQKFLATEFSLVKLFKQHLSDPAPSAFTSKYHRPAGTLVWQVVGDAIAHPFAQQEWNDFLLSCTWFSNNRNIMAEMALAFRHTGQLAVAGYGITQDEGAVKDWSAGKTPWVFNGIFCPYVTQKRADGLPGRNVTWADEFRALQQS